MTWQGDEYRARFDALAASGADLHGEATFVRAGGRAEGPWATAGVGTTMMG